MKMPAKKVMPKMKMKSLGALKNKSKGEVHHAEIHPAKNSDGSMAFLSRIQRERPPAAQAAMDAGGNYTAMPEPEETQHPNYPDAMDHVGKAFGAPKQAPPGEDDEDAEEGEE